MLCPELSILHTPGIIFSDDLHSLKSISALGTSCFTLFSKSSEDSLSLNVFSKIVSAELLIYIPFEASHKDFTGIFIHCLFSNLNPCSSQKGLHPKLGENLLIAPAISDSEHWHASLLLLIITFPLVSLHFCFSESLNLSSITPLQLSPIHRGAETGIILTASFIFRFAIT